MPETIDNHIGDRIRDVRKRRGLTQRELATAASVSLSLVRKLEQGEVDHTRMETARRLAVALRVPTTRLLQRDAENADTPTTDQWAPVAQALTAPPGHDDVNEAPTVTGMRDALAEALRLRDRHQFADLARMLPADPRR